MKIPLLLTLILFFPCQALSHPPSVPADVDPGIRGVLSRIEREASAIQRLTSDFSQEVHTTMLKEVLYSKGRFHFEQPNRLIWEIVAPSPWGVIVEGRRGKRWQGKKDRSQNFELDREPFLKLFVEQVLNWIKADFQRLGQEYHIAVLKEHPVTLRVKPRSASARAYLDHLQIVFAADLKSLRMIEIHGADGDLTRIQFFNTVVNGPRGKDWF
jgi:outer membrane lipoprotein-sorting protein